MSQALTRNNFSDILLDPTTIGVIGSIAVHAIFAANLAFFTQPSKELKKPEPGTVKVVKLTANELQRIPQAPKVAAVPTPSQQVLPPVYQPTIPAPPVTQSVTPPIVATSPTTIPLSPIPVTPPPQTKTKTKTNKVAAKSPVIRIPPKEKVVTKPPQPKRDQKATPQSQPQPPAFDPDFSFTPPPENTPTPTPTPTPAPTKPKIATKPSPQPSPTPPKQKTTATRKPPKTQREIDGEEQDDREPSKRSAPEARVDIDVPLPGTKTASAPKGSPSSQTADRPPSGGQIGSFERNNAVAVNAKLQEYIKKYPGIVLYPAPLKPILKPYPSGVACSKVKQPPVTVLFVPLEKVPENNESNVLGTNTPDSFDASSIGIDNEELSTLAKKFGVEEAKKADKNRPLADKGKEVLYVVRVQFDPTTCKK
jgi:hypothetical protein